jgi:hypothetical protein
MGTKDMGPRAPACPGAVPAPAPPSTGPSTSEWSTCSTPAVQSRPAVRLRHSSAFLRVCCGGWAVNGRMDARGPEMAGIVSVIVAPCPNRARRVDLVLARQRDYRVLVVVDGLPQARAQPFLKASGPGDALGATDQHVRLLLLLLLLGSYWRHHLRGGGRLRFPFLLLLLLLLPWLSRMLVAAPHARRRGPWRRWLHPKLCLSCGVVRVVVIGMGSSFSGHPKQASSLLIVSELSLTTHS